MCGDQYPVELILGPLLHHQSVYCNASAGPDTVILETYVGTVKRTVSITLSSYHRESSFLSFILKIIDTCLFSSVLYFTFKLFISSYLRLLSH